MRHADLGRNISHRVLKHAQLRHLLPAGCANLDPRLRFLGRDDLLAARNTFCFISLVLRHTLRHLANLVPSSKGPLGRVGVSADIAAGLRHVPPGPHQGRGADLVLNRRAALVRPSRPQGVLGRRRHFGLDPRVVLRARGSLDVRGRHPGLGPELRVPVVGLRVDFGLDGVGEGVLDLEVVVGDRLAQGDLFVSWEGKRRG